MIKGVVPITSADFNKGLVTRSDFLKGDINASPNTMDVSWQFDASLHKRFGCSSTNTIAIGSIPTAGWIIDSSGSLSNSLVAYWKMDEASGTRVDQLNKVPLSDFGGVGSIVGIRNQAANFTIVDSQSLYNSSTNAFGISSSNFSFGLWVNLADTSGGDQNIFVKRDAGFEYDLIYSNASAGFVFRVSTDGASYQYQVKASSIGVIATTTWYNIICWQTTNSHIGISVNLSVNTMPTANNVIFGSNGLCISGTLNGGVPNTPTNGFRNGSIDEVGFWKKTLDANDRLNLWAGGSGNTFTSQGNNRFSWASFDFGASSIRWLTVSAGTGIMASSNLGTTFVTIATSRTQFYQSLTRSKNVLIATSDSYDPTLYWAGSVGTFAATLAPNSAPLAKFAVNYQGFLILLNFMNSNNVIRNRGFAYADENLQLTDTWQNSFDIPSSADDEITASFILYKFLYVSTRYTIYRVAFVGGNPDWSYLKIKDWGFVPRTVQIVSLKGGGQVAIGMDWDRRIRAFDGFDDMFLSDNIENDNGICDFAMQKVSYAGSGLVVSNAVLNPVTQEYRLNVAIGAQSTQTTHSIILNARNLAFYPYSNQGWQTMCVAESNNQRHLMAADRSGFVYILDSGNLDVATPIAEVYDSPPLFSSKLPESVSKGKQLNMFFATQSSGTVHYQERFNLSNTWSESKRLSNREGISEMTGTENAIKLVRTIDVKSTYNTYQFRISSSGNTFNNANPWQLDRLDYLQQGFGIGQG